MYPLLGDTSNNNVVMNCGEGLPRAFGNLSDGQSPL
jgi:hypothetical protein